MHEQPGAEIDRKTAAQTLIAGVGAAVLCVFTWQFGFVSRFALVLAPSLLLLGVAGLVDIRILRAAVKKPGESAVHLPRWAPIAEYLCWSPTFILLGYLLVRSLAQWMK